MPKTEARTPPASALPRWREVVIYKVRLSYIERYAEFDDAECEATRPPLLLLHGLVASSTTFNSLIAELPRDRRIIAVDLPGVDEPGRAEKSDLSLSGLAQLMLSFSRAIGLVRPIILGHSHGGGVALQMAVSFPQTISGLILLCPAHPFLYRERPLIAFYNSPFGAFFGYSLRWVPRALQGFGFRRVLGPVGRKARVDFRPYRERLTQREPVSSALRLLKTWNIDMDGLGRQMEAQPIEAPTLFLWGDHDRVVPLDTAPALQKHMLQWEQFILPGVGHLPNDEAPVECGALIRTWLIWHAEGRLR